MYCSKIFKIERDRTSQSGFAVFTGQKLHVDEVVKQAQDYLEGKLHERISIDELSSKFAVSRRNFDRRVIKATQYRDEYFQRVKLKQQNGHVKPVLRP